MVRECDDGSRVYTMGKFRLNYSEIEWDVVDLIAVYV